MGRALVRTMPRAGRGLAAEATAVDEGHRGCGRGSVEGVGAEAWVEGT